VPFFSHHTLKAILRIKAKPVPGGGKRRISPKIPEIAGAAPVSPQIT
jgi:hypothetical protein